MKKLIILLFTILLLCGCELATEQNDYENIETCKNNGGTPKIEFFNDTNEISGVSCIYGVVEK